MRGLRSCRTPIRNLPNDDVRPASPRKRLSARRSAGARRNARCGQAHQVEAPSEDWDGWNAWADVRIAAALEQHEKLFAVAAGKPWAKFARTCEGNSGMTRIRGRQARR